MSEKSIESVLNLEQIVFDYIKFDRLGFQSDKELTFSMNTTIGKKENEEIYKVTLKLSGDKPDEYKFSISLSGFFSFENVIDVKLKESLIQKNAVAILMPYLRSEVSLLTAQPSVECVVLPAFNINALLENQSE